MFSKLKVLVLAMSLSAIALLAAAGEMTVFDWINKIGDGVSGPQSSVFPCDNVARTWSWAPPASYTNGQPVYIVGFSIANGDDKGTIADISAGASISDGRFIYETGEDHYAERTGGMNAGGQNPVMFSPHYMTLKAGQSINMIATCHAFNGSSHNALFQFSIYLVQQQPSG
jgi:hypothetical protein